MPLVVTRLIGGLGNQMFQYATGRALALRRGADLKLDITRYGTSPIHAKRRYELDSFSIHGSVASGREIARFGRTRRWWRFGKAEDSWPIYREPHFQFDPAVPDLPAPVYLDGYWQSERYFSDIAGMLRQEFAAKEPWERENEAVAAAIDSANAVSLHVRRGDYVSDPLTNRYHGICSPDYYQDAVYHITGRVGAPHIFVFSDDQEWTRANLCFAVPTTFVGVNSPDCGYRDMLLMARCRHHIIANSSFSWWGAWLNPTHDKIVVAPKQWFGASSNDTCDLIPPSWVRL